MSLALYLGKIRSLALFKRFEHQRSTYSRRGEEFSAENKILLPMVEEEIRLYSYFSDMGSPM